MLTLRSSRVVIKQDLTAGQIPFSSKRASKPVKLIYVINDLSVGGAEMMLYKLLAESDRNRFEPVVISLIDRGALRQRIEGLGIAVHTTRMKPGLPSPLGLWRLVRLMVGASDS